MTGSRRIGWALLCKLILSGMAIALPAAMLCSVPARVNGSAGGQTDAYYGAGMRIQSSLPGSINSTYTDYAGDFIMTASLPEVSTATAPTDGDWLSQAMWESASQGQKGYILKTRENRLIREIEPVWVQGLYETPNTDQPYVGDYNVAFADAIQLTGGGYAAVGYGSSSSVYYSVYENQPVWLADMQGGTRYRIIHRQHEATGSRSDALVVRMDNSGLIRKVAAREANESEAFRSAAPSVDGGFVAAGYSKPRNASGNGLLVKYNWEGTSEWESRLTGGGSFNAVAAANGGGYIVAGHTEEAPGSTVDITSSLEPGKVFRIPSGGYLARFDSSGRVLWLTHVSGTSRMNAVTLSPGGESYVGAGTGAEQLIMVKLDDFGELLASSAVASGAGDEMISVIPAQEGGYWFGSIVRESLAIGDPAVAQYGQSQGGGDWLVIRTDGELSARVLYYAGGSGREQAAGRMLSLTGTGFVIAGSSSSSDGDMSVLKPAYNGRDNAAALTVTFDRDGDLVIDSRDYYPNDISRVYPVGEDALHINYEQPASVTLDTYVARSDLYGLNALDMVAVRASPLSDPVVYTSPASALDNLVRLGHQLEFSRKELTAAQSEEVTSLLPAPNYRLADAIELHVSLSGNRVSYLGTSTGITMPLQGLTRPEAAKLYYYDEAGRKLVEVTSARFSGEEVFFLADYLSVYVVGVLDSADVGGDLAKVEETMQRINSLPSEIRLSDKETIASARAAYNSLSTELQTMVPAAVLRKLTEAEAAYSWLQFGASVSAGQQTTGGGGIYSFTEQPELPSGMYLLNTIQILTFQGSSGVATNSYTSVSMTFDSTRVPAGYTVDLYYYDDRLSKWIAAGGKLEGDTVTGNIPYFKRFGVFAVVAPQPSADNLKVVLQHVPLKDTTGHWAEANINELIARSVVQGYSDGTFWPDYSISRAEFVAILVRALKITGQGNGGEFVYTDMNEDHWAVTYIRLAAASGLIVGYDDGSFRPDQPVSRSEMAVLLTRALHLEQDGDAAQPQFADGALIEQWALEPVRLAAQAGLLESAPGSLFRPRDNATRAEAATVVLRAMKQSGGDGQ
ncbi:MAG: hypothetical protein K0R57_1744 [Paenibacillaceae bacterium]|jgi:hypothetical protein|nr:hypothetical protein [Paenibacillaceae bacterium]